MAAAAYSNKLARIRPSWRWFYILLALLASSIIAFVIIQPITVLPRITLAPGFNLIDQNGRFISTSLRLGNVQPPLTVLTITCAGKTMRL